MAVVMFAEPAVDARTPGKPTIYEALSRVMAAVQAVRKGDRNNEQGYNFRGIDAVVNAVGPALREHGVLVTPELLEVGYRDVLTSQGKPSRECTVRVRYTFHGPGGDHLDVVVPGESMDFGDKGAAKAMSVAFRIALLQALAIPTDEPEHEPDASSYERAERAPQIDPDVARQNILANARNAISEADEPGLTAIDQRITHYVQREQITTQDAVELRRMLVARLDVLHPSGEQTAIEQPAEDCTAEPAGQEPMEGDWPARAKPGPGDAP